MNTKKAETDILDEYIPIIPRLSKYNDRTLVDDICNGRNNMHFGTKSSQYMIDKSQNNYYINYSISEQFYDMKNQRIELNKLKNEIQSDKYEIKRLLSQLETDNTIQKKYEDNTVKIILTGFAIISQWFN
jgi:hypothetical protein